MWSICHHIPPVESGLDDGAWSGPGTFDPLSGAGAGEGGERLGESASGIDPTGGDDRGAWSGPCTFVERLSSNRFCDAAFTFFITFASRRTSGASRAATGAASAKLMMESIRRVRVSISCCRIFMGYVRDGFDDVVS